MGGNSEQWDVQRKMNATVRRKMGSGGEIYQAMTISPQENRGMPKALQYSKLTKHVPGRSNSYQRYL